MQWNISQYKAAPKLNKARAVDTIISFGTDPIKNRIFWLAENQNQIN